jgi:hypothetical protein
MITIITMSQGNPIALRRTLDSFSGICNEFIIGDLFIFDDDRKQAKELCKDLNVVWLRFPFNFIFENGFACILNNLARHASNDLVMYMNVGEVIDKNLDMTLIKPEYNCYSFNHAVDPHRWVRMYNRHEMYWTGMIHEIVVGSQRLCPTHLFMMADTEKDMENPWKAKVMNDVKELVYWNQYLRLINRPDLIGFTSQGWVTWARDSYDSFTERMQNKGNRLKAFELGDLQIYLNDVRDSGYFSEERMESSKLINLQGQRLDIL